MVPGALDSLADAMKASMIVGHITRADQENTRRLLASQDALQSEVSEQLESLAGHIGGGLGELSRTLDEGFADLSRKLDAPNEMLAAEYYRNAVAAAQRHLVPEALERVNKAIFGDGLKTTGYPLSWQFHWLRGQLLLSDEAASAGVADPEEAWRSFRQCARLAQTESMPDAALALYFAGRALEASALQKGASADSDELLACYSGATAADASLDDATFHEARIRFRVGDREKAFELLTRISRKTPSFLVRAADADEFAGNEQELQRFLKCFRSEIVQEIIVGAQSILDRHPDVIAAFPAIWRDGVAGFWRRVADGSELPGAVDVAAYVRDRLESDKSALIRSIRTLDRVHKTIQQTRDAVSEPTPQQAQEVLQRWEQLPSLTLNELLDYARNPDARVREPKAPDSASPLMLNRALGRAPATPRPTGGESGRRNQPPVDPFAWFERNHVRPESGHRLSHDVLAFAIPTKVSWNETRGLVGIDCLGRESEVVSISQVESRSPRCHGTTIEFSDSISRGCEAVIIRSLNALPHDQHGVSSADANGPRKWSSERVAAICNAISLLAGRTPAYDADSRMPNLEGTGYRLPTIDELKYVVFAARRHPGNDSEKSTIILCHGSDGAIRGWSRDSGKKFPHRDHLSDEHAQLRICATVGAALVLGPESKPVTTVEPTLEGCLAQGIRRLFFGFLILCAFGLMCMWCEKALRPTLPIQGTGGCPTGYLRIAPGTFTMGSPTGEEGREDDETQHRVTITRGYCMKATEVTQGEWQAVMGSNPSTFMNCGANCPVEQVSWDDAVGYANALSRREGLPECYAGSTFTGLGCTGYRLPTESEWEYAARAGTTGATYGNLDSVAWRTENSGSATHPVGQKQPNAWGLYDMLGNVLEWTGDWYGTYPATVIDPTGATTGSSRVNRGGSWRGDARTARAAFRFSGSAPVDRGDGLGFRLVRTAP